jgi:CRISPR-associated endonuclease/helicase Cas3
LACQYWDGLAFLIAGHHAGLPSVEGLKKRLGAKRAAPAVLKALDLARQVLSVPPSGEVFASLAPEFVRASHANDTERRLNLELFLRLLFSALVDADFLDTEQHFRPDLIAKRGPALGLDVLWNRFETDQSKLSGKLDSLLQRQRHAVYEACLQAGDLPQGLFRLTVPTGGGKTRSGLAFGLRHALKHQLDRIVVAIPYTSIIEQTADVYTAILGSEAVLEHHSALKDRDDRADPVSEREQWNRLASENWDAPLIVTTTVQLFESLFAHRPSRCRKIHNLARSVVILDEVQTLPPHLLDPILDVLRQLVRYYRVTVVLCTATQPALSEGRYLRGLTDVRDIISDPGPLFRSLRRVNYEYAGGELWTWQRVANEMQAGPQALAVVNTKKDALALLDALRGDPAVLHLSTLLCGVHRAAVLKEVRRRLDSGEGCRLVSTQVVEAGVDLDFPLVLRALGPLDRIVQAAGRCNRENRLPDGGRVVIFNPAEGGCPPGAYRTGTETAASLLHQACDLHDPLTYERYFTLLFQSVETDREKLQPLRQRLDYPEVAQRFHLIDDDGAPVVVRAPGHEKTVAGLLGALRSASDTPRWLIRKLQRFVVNIHSTQVSAYESRGLLSEVAPGLWEWHGGYDPVRGIVDAAQDPDWLVC